MVLPRHATLRNQILKSAFVYHELYHGCGFFHLISRRARWSRALRHSAETEIDASAKSKKHRDALAIYRYPDPTAPNPYLFRYPNPIRLSLGRKPQAFASLGTLSRYPTPTSLEPSAPLLSRRSTPAQPTPQIRIQETAISVQFVPEMRFLAFDFGVNLARA
eukprot:49672-Rhodomonas_salina.1